ncbi:MAG: prolyl oligopeptidase family serine peptidase [Verrucomicrobia bacterium]|nr:prolyl oligopeptidase family serine peptidase [Verrucomicrobiota bacterium]
MNASQCRSDRPAASTSKFPANRWILAALLVGACSLRQACADGVADNKAENVRRQPPPGKPIAEADRTELERGVAELGQEISSLGRELANRPPLMALLPDVQVFHKAVAWALQNDEFYNPTNEVAFAKDLLRQGLERARHLREGRSPWTTATGLIVRGYASRLDGSVQPYGLVVPASFQSGAATQHRLDFWFHGRGETLTELSFIRDLQRSAGEFTPKDAFVLHPYSRYCNGQKLAGEVDAFEALEHAQRNYPIDANRLVVRGFSLGGAACWHMTVHHASRWAASAPGAGFSETADFLKIFQKESLQPSAAEQTLWHWYDCPDYVVNLTHCPTVVYSGENDSQKQAADIMVQAASREGLELTHVIGAKAGHHYTPDAKAEINRRIDSIVARGREIAPRHVRFATWTLKYNQMAWVTVDALEHHWQETRVDASLQGDAGVEVTTRNVAELTLEMPAGFCALDPLKSPKVSIDGQALMAAKPASDRSWLARFEKRGGEWKVRAPNTPATEGLRKRHNLQGPIDDAFMESFLMVKPSGEGWHGTTRDWAQGEFQHAVEHWRRHFRGDARVKEDRDVSDKDIAAHNLVLWGDPGSNKILERILPSLPIQWDKSKLRLGGSEWDATRHMPALIFPNPLNPARYVVLNSGFTFREYDYLNNARQVAKLPDYAILDVSKPATSRFAGEVASEGFFDESWRAPSR